MSETSGWVSRRAARLGLGAIIGVAVLEWGAAAAVYRPAIAPEDWAATAQLLDTLPPEDPVRLGTPWLGPRARMHLPRLARWDSVAPADLRGAPSFHVLGLDGDRWSDPLQHDLEDLPAPTLVQTRPLGGLTLYSYALPQAGRPLADLVTDAATLEVDSDAGACRGRAPWTCPDGRVSVATIEVDYRPRRCLKLEVEDGATVRLRYPQMPTGTAVHGHVGFHDFNARLRSDAPGRVRLRVDGQTIAQWLVSDTQGWWPFAAATTPGVHDVELELTAAVRGTWQRAGYQSNRSHAPCVELRSLAQEPT